jgi:hypothetical protein
MAIRVNLKTGKTSVHLCDPTPVKSGKRQQRVKTKKIKIEKHNCWDNAVPYTGSGGPLNHGWECGYCGEFLQAG